MPTNEFGPDGTQAPPPPRLFPDPLAGLVTADTWTASQWSGQWAQYAASRVIVAVPPTPTEEMRKAIWAAMEQEQRRPRNRRQRAQAPQQQYVPQQFPHAQQIPVAQQQQPTKQTNGVAAFIGCLVVIGFFVLIVISILGAIFS
ncbi:hypothetical protein FXN61_21325 [Lentzea sp. PSKA42]|uniref:Uncharacterized protein n=1 Tax=Lentzea indica TaxID=2604800 RepID=A0ABX1FK65_9PSEU|nr:hypothetical protein [Lentzea indica]NKE59217.1 hypothetical protein [Lentzea indica]